VLLFSHAATAIMLVRAFVGDPGLNIQVGCCSISELVRKKDGDINGGALGGYEPVMLVSGAHLENGADRAWGFDHLEIVDGKVSQLCVSPVENATHITAQVVEEPGIPGSENERDEPVGLQMISSRLSSNL
jgi:transcription factor C subunit 7